MEAKRPKRAVMMELRVLVRLTRRGATPRKETGSRPVVWEGIHGRGETKRGGGVGCEFVHSKE